MSFSVMDSKMQGDTMKNIFGVLTIAASLLAGCAITNETSLVIGQARAPIKADQVKLYTTPPDKYEEIAIVSADAAHDFMSKQDLLNISVAKIKEEAAKVGANGVLLDNVGDSYIGSSGMMTSMVTKGRGPVVGVGAMNARTGKVVSGKAIFVSP